MFDKNQIIEMWSEQSQLIDDIRNGSMVHEDELYSELSDFLEITQSVSLLEIGMKCPTKKFMHNHLFSIGLCGAETSYKNLIIFSPMFTDEWMMTCPRPFNSEAYTIKMPNDIFLDVYKDSVEILKGWKTIGFWPETRIEQLINNEIPL